MVMYVASMAASDFRRIFYREYLIFYSSVSITAIEEAYDSTFGGFAVRFLLSHLHGGAIGSVFIARLCIAFTHHRSITKQT